MNARPLIVPPSVPVVVVDDCHIVPIVSAMVNNSVSRDIGPGRGIVESDSNEGDDDQNHHQSETAEPSNVEESLGRIPLLVCFRRVFGIYHYENLPPVGVYILHFRDAGVVGIESEVSRVPVPTIENPSGDLGGVIRGVGVSHCQNGPALVLGKQVGPVGVMVHCLEPIGRMRGS